jgi:hypothetical protein
MLQENLRHEVNYYLECMANSYIGDTGKCFDDVIFDADFIEQLEQDLEDKGFTENEATEVYCGTYSKDITKYKILAYCYKLYDGFETVEELKQIIRESDESRIEDFTEEEIQQIFEASKLVDY